MRFLVTGTAGFIGFHVAKRLLDDGHDVVGIDGFTTYYDASLKEARHAELEKRNRYRGYRVMLEDQAAIERIWADHEVDVLIHLAAQAGVRYSLENPRAYLDSNVVGTFNLLELLRARPVRHALLASTSSAYGANTKMPFAETDRAVTPMTIYAATKLATEMMAHSYAHIYNIPTTLFRFFTVYGPWGRPDMAVFKFTKAISNGETIDVYNNGELTRDFTYIDDLVEAIVRLVDCVPPTPDAAVPTPIDGDTLSPVAPYRLVNIGRGSPVWLNEFIAHIERAVGKPAIKNHMPMQPGEMHETYCDTRLLEALTGYRPQTPLGDGIDAFVTWYQAHYGA